MALAPACARKPPRLDGDCVILPAFLPPHLALAACALAALAFATLIGGLFARAGFPLPAADRRIGCVDGLRGYLALSVMIHHFVIWRGVALEGLPWQAPSVNLLSQLGAGAVALFFMTTGLVFYPRILQGWRRNRWRAIYVGRVFRIVPLVAVSVAAIVVVIAWRTGARPGIGDIVPLAKWVTAWSQPPLLGDPGSGRLNAYVLWSLWHEWFFYLLVLPACAFAGDLVRPRLPSWAVPLGLLVAALALRSVPLPRGVPTFLPLFALGMLAFEASARPRIATLLRRRAMALPAIVALAVAAIGAPDPYAPPQLLLFGFFFTCVACGNDLFGLLATRGALVLGECSFGIYLLHGLVLSLLFVEGAPLVRATSGDPLLLVPTAAIVACLTAFTYRTIERPAIDLGRRLAERLRGRAPAPRPAELEVAP